MRPPRAERGERSVLGDALLGFAGGVLGSLAMNLFVRSVNAGDGREPEGAARGHDRYGRGVQPGQAAHRAADDATVRTAVTAFRLLAGDEQLTRDAKRTLGVLTHYAFGGSMGLLYGILAPRTRALRAGFGTAYGTLVWAAADEGAIPALGLSRGPRRLPWGMLAFGLAGHLAYGVTLEAVRRSGDRVRRSVPALGMNPE